MPNRRSFLQAVIAGATMSASGLYAAGPGDLIRKVIPSSGQQIPAVGMGTWITFDIASEQAALATRVRILQRFFEMGGTMIDSSPMYGRAQAVIGHCLRQLENHQQLFSATKVWIPGRQRGIDQMAYSEELWGLQQFDLMQVHNMVDWQAHLKTLTQWKDQQRVRYTGITTSHGRRHSDMASVITSQPFDFVQFTYNIADRQAERQLLPLAQEHGRAVIINRPFRTGGLFRTVRGKPLPDWAAKIGCKNWAQYFLKFVISHPTVTCVIPATSQVQHMEENMGACYGQLPDQAMRDEMVRYYQRVSA